MGRPIAMLLIGLIFGAGIGFTLAATNGISLEGHEHDHSDPAQHADGMPHDGDDQGQMAMADGDDSGAMAHHDHGEVLSLPEGDGAPTLKVEMVPDSAAGWNLHIMTGNFTFAPEHAGGEHVDGEGHAHVYVNGEKIARAYGPWMHIGNLPEGTVEVEVTLNANDHRQLAVGDKPLAETLTLDN